MNYQSLLNWLDSEPSFSGWLKQLPEQIAQGLSPARWGDLPQWQAVLDSLPAITPSKTDFSEAVQIGTATDCDPQTQQFLQEQLMLLHPWRKGPFKLFGIDIDTEWRSDWKWDRVLPHIAPLNNRLVLDVGCGNGYHCLRMLGAGAKRVIGIDPSPRFIYQFAALKHFTGDIPADVLPLGIEHMPGDLPLFDSVFSMGVIYHRREPQQHLRELKNLLRPGGQVILETLVIEGGPGDVLQPDGRYAKMRNVWALPSPDTALQWLQDAGFENPRLADIAKTSLEEQRRTDWMRFESLPDFLHPENPALTIEGHPAPIRAVFIAEKPF